MLHSSALSSFHFFPDCSNLGEDTTEYEIGSRLAFASFFATQIKMKELIIAWIEYEMEAIVEKKPSILGQLKDKFGLVEGKYEHGKVKHDRDECR